MRTREVARDGRNAVCMKIALRREAVGNYCFRESEKARRNQMNTSFLETWLNPRCGAGKVQDGCETAWTRKQGSIVSLIEPLLKGAGLKGLPLATSVRI